MLFVDALAVVSLTGIAATTLAMGAFSVGMPMLLVAGMVGGGRPAPAISGRPEGRSEREASRSAA